MDVKRAIATKVLTSVPSKTACAADIASFRLVSFAVAGAFSVKSGIESMYLGDRPTQLICISDFYMVGLIRTTMWCGVNIVRTKYGAE